MGCPGRETGSFCDKQPVEGNRLTSINSARGGKEAHEYKLETRWELIVKYQAQLGSFIKSIQPNALCDQMTRIEKHF